MATERSSNIPDSWKIEDLIDFEYLLAQRAEPRAGIETANWRADEDFRSRILPALPSRRNPSRQLLFRSWLELQREAAKYAFPGEHWKSAWQFLVVLSIVTGTGLGASVTASLLLYRGDVPVNVLWFLACTIGVQFVVLAIALALWLLRRTTGLLDEFRPLRSLLDGLVWTTSSGLRKLPGEQRDRVRAILARLRRRRDIYSTVAAWPFVAITQIFGVCFNVGIIAVFLVQISVKDIEFGWQSSFLKSDRVLFGLVSQMATPWKWFAPEPYPTEAEIAASHFEYKKQGSNKSWWPFLCYSVCCYGFLLRTGLLICVVAKWRHTLRGLKFDHEGCSTLYRQLIGPCVRAEQDAGAATHAPSGTGTKTDLPPSGEAFAIVANEAGIANDALARHLRDQFAWTLAEYCTTQVDHPGANAALFSALAERAAGLAAVVVVLPAQRPPIKAIALFIAKISAALTATPAEVILLLLRRSDGSGNGPVGEKNLTYWHEFVVINKLQVSLETWAAE